MAESPVEVNRRVLSNARHAAEKLRLLWGWGGPNGMNGLSDWQDWFIDLYYDAMNLLEENNLNYWSQIALLNACDSILELNVPHQYHIKYIVRIRNRLRPNWHYDDWPEGVDITGMEYSSDDDSDGVFDMEM